MAIADATLRSDVWTDIRNKLVAAAPSQTNSETTVVTVASISGRYDDKKGVSRKPQIVIEPIKKDEADYKFGSINGKKTINVFINVYAKADEFCDQIADQIDTALAANDINGIDLIATSSEIAFVNPQEVKYKLINLVYTYQRE